MQSLCFLNTTVKPCMTIWFGTDHTYYSLLTVLTPLSLAPHSKAPTCFKCTCFLNGHNSTEVGSSDLSLKSDRSLVLMGFLARYHSANLHGFYPITPDALSITDWKDRLVPHLYLSPCPGAASNASHYTTVTNQPPSLGQNSHKSEPHMK